MKRSVRRWWRWLSVLILAAAVLAGISAWRIASYAPLVTAGHYDCAIVLGAALVNDEPSPVFEGRLEHALELYRQGRVGTLLLTGGRATPTAHAESECALRYLTELGVPQDRIRIEDRSHTTHENLIEAKRVMQENSWSNAVIVSDPYHLSRAMMMAKDLQLHAVASGTPTSRYRSWISKAPFLAREVLFSGLYRVIGK
ncbi:YdcF family protein [Haloferula sp. BvORR071]|uniref:YdcF family protein n=1 Tax=Haloferula sp. BvORR071 TaxID=1396141 RepID=UPI000557CBD3|nr:YdcF family protein [Haloferula sp. BvORR071]